MPVKNIKKLKNELRAKHRRIRENCPENVKIGLDKRISELFLSLDEYKGCNDLFLFVSSSIEFDTSEIMQKAFDDGKRVAVPKCRDQKGFMDFYYITSSSQLEKGAFGIYEPKGECERVTDLSKGVCVVPGLCFDMYGYRIGFGMGYYDRFLENFGGTKVGLCYSKCTEHELPKGLHDMPVDILITEKFVNHTPDTNTDIN